MERKVVLYSPDPGFLEQRGHVLDRRSTVVHPAATADGLRAVLEAVEAQLVVVNGSRGGEELARVFEVLRDRTRADETAIVVVLRPEARSLLPDWLLEHERAEVLDAPVADGVLLRQSALLCGWPVRRHVRVLVQVRVQVKQRVQTLFGFTHDLSVGGMGLVLAGRQLETGEQLVVHFWLPNAQEELSVEAEVLRTQPHPDGLRFGLRFIDMPEKAKAALEAFVHAES